MHAPSRLARAAAAASLAVLTIGCAARRPYTPPSTAPAALRHADDPRFAAAPYDGRWWQQFDDPVLVALEEAALAANHDVRIAVARLQQARAVFDDVALDRFPTSTVGASVDRREQAVPGVTDDRVSTTTYRAGFDAFWEIDLFGRVRSAVAATRAEAQGLQASLDDVRVSVAAEVASTYFELRGAQWQLAVAERSLANQRETLRLTRVRRDNGIGEEQDVASAAARVAAIEASLPALRAAIEVRTFRLAVLAGVRPGELGVDLSSREYAPLTRPLPIGEPATFLARRPDVRAAERRLAAAAAREGIAAAELFPRISVSGFLGLVTGRGSLFGKSESRAWAVTPALSWAGLDLGSARARLRGAQAGTREALAAYEQAVLLALEETESAFVGYRTQQDRLLALAEQARESARAAEIARIRYREGLADFLALLDAERTQLEAENAVARSEADVFTSVVAVYKALGGIGPAAAPATAP